MPMCVHSFKCTRDSCTHKHKWTWLSYNNLRSKERGEREHDTCALLSSLCLFASRSPVICQLSVTVYRQNDCTNINYRLPHSLYAPEAVALTLPQWNSTKETLIALFFGFNSPWERAPALQRNRLVCVWLYLWGNNKSEDTHFSTLTFSQLGEWEMGAR